MLDAQSTQTRNANYGSVLENAFSTPSLEFGGVKSRSRSVSTIFAWALPTRPPARHR